MLELVFVFNFFSGFLSDVEVYTGAATCLLSGLGSLFISIYVLTKKVYSAISLCIMLFSVLIIFFTIIAYFLPEAGYPPPIRLFFKF